jgi:imidazolonepropionase-like amidohydrolase
MIKLTALVRLTLLGAALAVSPSMASSRPIAITDVNVVDVDAGAVLRRTHVVIEGDRITGVGTRIPSGATRLPGRGRYLIPGLWDMHTHHQASGEASLPLFLANGVTGTRDMGSELQVILPMRDRIARGELLGPEIVAAGPVLDAAPAHWPWRRRVDSAAEAEVAVRSLKQAGVDFIKVHDSTPREAYFAIAAAAKREGLPFAGHVPGAVRIEEAAKAGQASIEHLANFRVLTECSGGVTYDAARCVDHFQMLARNRVWQTPTLAFYVNLGDLLSGRPPPAVQYATPGLLRLWRENAEASALTEDTKALLRGLGQQSLSAVGDMKRHGVRFLSGCDGLVPGFCLHDELEWMTKAGMTPAEALRTATIEPADFLGRRATQGAVKPGQRADLVLLEKDPLQDIRNTRSIVAVVLRGRVIQAAELRRALTSLESTAGRAAP